MTVLIIFETVEGQTRKIVKFLEQHLQSEGHSVRLFDTQDALGELSFNGVDRIVLAAPVHERRHPVNFEVLLAASRADLKALPTLLISVSLKAAFPEGLDEARDYLTEMEMRTGFVPDNELLVAGAVRTGSYGYYESQIVQNVALQGHEVELTDGVREFTDWESLKTEVSAFLQSKPST